MTKSRTTQVLINKSAALQLLFTSTRAESPLSAHMRIYVDVTGDAEHGKSMQRIRAHEGIFWSGTQAGANIHTCTASL